MIVLIAKIVELHLQNIWIVVVSSTLVAPGVDLNLQTFWIVVVSLSSRGQGHQLICPPKDLASQSHPREPKDPLIGNA